MHILITSAASATARVIADSVADNHKIRLTDLSHNADGKMIANDLDDGSLTDDLVSGVDAIINVGFEGQTGTDTPLMDYHTRCIYNLLYAASCAGVSRFINISTLRLYENHEENLVVTERWRTDPSAEDVAILGAHMTESVCKEFARDRLIDVVNIRFGWPFVETISPDCSQTAATSHGLIAATVNESLLTDLLEPWQDVHVQSPVKHQRFITNTAAKLFPNLADRLV
ncbi:MAG: hypothetical protein QF595_13615 [Dehalococcoidia bacterium]|nr:hypothetical protein [Dehalococcoidia bacterium]